jgi:hypothetical protein
MTTPRSPFSSDLTQIWCTPSYVPQGVAATVACASHYPRSLRSQVAAWRKVWEKLKQIEVIVERYYWPLACFFLVLKIVETRSAYVA